MQKTAPKEDFDFDWSQVAEPMPTPLQDWADQRNQEIEQAISRTIEPIAQLQQQVNALQDGISNLSAQQKATVDRRTVLTCLWILFVCVAWIQIIQPIVVSGIKAGQAIGEAVTGTDEKPSVGQRFVNGYGVLENQTCIRMMKPSLGEKTSPFGERIHPITGERKMHWGTDYAAGMGSPIVAAAAGRVTMAEDAGGLGLAIEIDHGAVNGTTIKTRYGHLSEMLVRVGDLVSPGQVIAKEGSTGMSTGPHLHFEAYLNDEPVDPEPFVDKYWGAGCPGK
ncbi:M23 family metallopeptidase [Leptolyngbya ohadii]|uniref:M23 family metallopeptidase n=1 Tax=Leptolyngbya ohadii TaxID=1962290 RepID=UPI000B599F1D|nr:M23 family metallopeptidase [Leptolyngbya ohadii]